MAVAVLPPTLTVTVVVPALRAVISPAEDTVAIGDEAIEYVAALFVASAGVMTGLI